MKNTQDQDNSNSQFKEHEIEMRGVMQCDDGNAPPGVRAEHQLSNPHEPETGVEDASNAADKLTGERRFKDYTPTHRELLVLAAYWDIEWAVNYYKMYVFDQASPMWGHQAEAAERLDHISELIGERALEHIQKQVTMVMETTTDRYTWEMFLRGWKLRRDDAGMPVHWPLSHTFFGWLLMTHRKLFKKGNQ